MPYRRSAARKQVLTLLLAIAPATAACSIGSHADGCRAEAITVAVTPAIAPAVEQTARRYNARTTCVRVTVTHEEPADVAGVLSGQGSSPGATRPDAWIPDSSLWLPVARRTKLGAGAVRPTGTSIASSPLVLAAAEGRSPSDVSWRLLLSSRLPGTGAGKPPVRVRFLDPTTQAAGLGALMLAHQASGPGKTGLGTFAITLYSDLSSALPDDKAAYAAMFRGGDPPTAVVLSEQSVWQHNHTDAKRPVSARYPRDGALALDFPYVSVTGDREKSRTVEDFRSALSQSQSREALQSLGLRTPDGVAGAGFGTKYGVASEAPIPARPQDPATVGKILQMWQRTVLGARMLILLDVSPSMGDPVPSGNDTRIRATTRAAISGTRILSDNSQVALWEFSTRLDHDLDYRQLVPYRPLTQKVGTGIQRDALITAFNAAQPVLGTRTALYDSVLAAYKEAVRTYQPDRNNVLVVLTDGMNYDPGHTILLQELMKELAKTADPLKPVAIVPIAFGPDIDPGPLQQIARATGGQAFVTLDPGQIQEVFLEMLIRLTCGQACPMS
ncbi:substrate-binding domain-containing protein [Actinomadura sp. DC4]|uniref:substrate-binding domain-containing protein n=1 Tax=Actinomadura sp. DC4 TaxID=3055069 RepID=UPI0025B033A1|nr:substrate-binding domain-containing protein [Actinomadura sp. DC4]MDN3351836.1 substrate-binding domain-containing protein [Actinomadura sp. DC4]